MSNRTASRLTAQRMVRNRLNNAEAQRARARNLAVLMAVIDADDEAEADRNARDAREEVRHG